MKYIKYVREHFAEKPAFSIRDLRIFLAKKGISKGYAQLLLHNLESSGEIQRITRGFYSFKDDASVSGFAFSPFYYGLQEALSLRNLWEQETNPVIITPKKVRTGVREIMGTNALLRRINRKMFFGFEPVKYYDYWLPVSDIEKTLIDFAYFREPIPKEVERNLVKRSSRDTLKKYLKKCPQYVKDKIKL